MAYRSMRTILATAILAFGLIAPIANAQTPNTYIPDRVECEEMARAGTRSNEAFGSRQNYLGCLVAGSVHTLLLESHYLTNMATKHYDEVTAARANIDENTDFNELEMKLETARAYGNLAAYTARYAKLFLPTVTPETQRNFYTQAFDLTIKISETRDRVIDLTSNLMSRQNPLPTTDGESRQASRLGFCHSNYAMYAEGRHTGAQRNIIDPQLYTSHALTCAGVSVNMYGLLPKPEVGDAQ